MGIIPILLALIMATTADRVTTFDGWEGMQLLKQCSRPAPAAGGIMFRPRESDVDRLERAVAIKVASVHGVDGLRSGWRVEVTGMVRNGRRYVYGSFMPMMEGEKILPTSRPTIICDGGARMFGAEIDAGSGRLTHYARNGPM